MKYIKCFKSITEIGNGVEIDTPNVVYLKNKNLLYVPKSSSNITIINDGSGNIKIAGTDEDEPVVIPLEITNTEVINNTLSLNVMQQLQIETNKDNSGEEITYESTDTTIATIDPTGLIVCYSSGTTDITVTCGNTVTITLTVTDESPDSGDDGDDTITTTTTKIPEISGQTQTGNEETNESSGNTGQTDPVTEAPTSTTSENPDGGSDNTEPNENPEVIDVDNGEHPL